MTGSSTPVCCPFSHCTNRLPKEEHKRRENTQMWNPTTNSFQCQDFLRQAWARLTEKPSTDLRFWVLLCPWKTFRTPPSLGQKGQWAAELKAAFFFLWRRQWINEPLSLFCILSSTNILVYSYAFCTLMLALLAPRIYNFHNEAYYREQIFNYIQ